MISNPVYKLLHSKTNLKQNEKTTYGLGENTCKWRGQQRLNFQDSSYNLVTKSQTTQ